MRTTPLQSLRTLLFSGSKPDLDFQGKHVSDQDNE